MDQVLLIVGLFIAKTMIQRGIVPLPSTEKESRELVIQCATRFAEYVEAGAAEHKALQTGNLN